MPAVTVDDILLLPRITVSTGRSCRVARSGSVILGSSRMSSTEIGRAHV